MSRREWEDLPWWEAELLIEEYIRENEETSAASEGNKPTDSKPVDLTSADTDLSGFQVRSVG